MTVRELKALAYSDAGLPRITHWLLSGNEMSRVCLMQAGLFVSKVGYYLNSCLELGVVEKLLPLILSGLDNVVEVDDSLPEWYFWFSAEPVLGWVQDRVYYRGSLILPCGNLDDRYIRMVWAAMLVNRLMFEGKCNLGIYGKAVKCLEQYYKHGWEDSRWLPGRVDLLRKEAL